MSPVMILLSDQLSTEKKQWIYDEYNAFLQVDYDQEDYSISRPACYELALESALNRRTTGTAQSPEGRQVIPRSGLNAATAEHDLKGCQTCARNLNGNLRTESLRTEYVF
jgi:hypothetical protein